MATLKDDVVINEVLEVWYVDYKKEEDGRIPRIPIPEGKTDIVFQTRTGRICTSFNSDGDLFLWSDHDEPLVVGINDSDSVKITVQR